LAVKKELAESYGITQEQIDGMIEDAKKLGLTKPSDIENFVVSKIRVGLGLVKE
jgi:DNA-binding transcriptional regulator LsrR (DeoR family)